MSKQSPILQKLQESLETKTIVCRLGEIDFVFCPKNMVSYLKRAGTKGRKQRDFNRLIKKVGTISSEEGLLNLLPELIRLGYPLLKLAGLSLNMPGKCFHCVRSWARVKHCLGLADAVHMSLFNLGLNVRLPRFVRVSARNNADGSYIHFRTVDKRPTKTVCRSVTCNRKFFLLLHYLRVFPKNLAEKDYVKWIKLSLNGLFSEKMNQELPVGYPEKSFPIFPNTTQKALDRMLRTNEKLKVRVYFNLIQSKALCAEVGQDMIEKAYRDHFDSLCRAEKDIVDVPQDFLTQLREYGRKVGKEISKYYDPYKTCLPNTRSTTESSRRQGGALKALSPQRSICSGSPILNFLSNTVKDQSSDIRVEPYVIGLFGPPGVGKTTSINRLVASLGSEFFPDFKRSDLVYSRSCSMDHWDGYRNQPIVVLDDFGQDLASRKDIVEFEQLVSVNRYLVPMAHLDEKGVCFNSPIIILTSNVNYGSNINISSQTPIVEESIAVWRRIKSPFVLSKGTHGTRFDLIDVERTLFTDRNVNVWNRKYNTSNSHLTASCTYSNATGIKKSDPSDLTFSVRNMSFRNVCAHAITEVHNFIGEHQRSFAPVWNQEIASYRVRYDDSNGLDVKIRADEIHSPYLKEDYSLRQIFSTVPPSEPPRCRTQALAEPLKVRMITVAEAEVKALQPLQKALLRYLESHPQFCLSNGCKKNQLHKDFMRDEMYWIERIEAQILGINSKKSNDEVFLSGDYTAATDNFPMSVTHELLEGILEFIPHEPTKAWARYECSSHILEYPGGKIGKQTSGQLMGSLLSFPLLCFLNDFIVSWSGFQKGKYLINGDDVVACGPNEVVQQWRENAPKVGLSLSLGKNFIHSRFCTVNSQLFYDGKCLHTGKVGCQTRLNKTIGFTFQSVQFYYGESDEVRNEFIRRNLLPLRKTVRSLKVPQSKGGLSLYDHCHLLTKNEEKMAKRSYLYDFLGPYLKSDPVAGFTPGNTRFGGRSYRAVPYPSFEEGKEQHMLDRLRGVFNEEEPSDESDDLSWNDTERQMKKVKKRLGENNVSTLNRILSRPFSVYPRFESLGLHTRYMVVEEGKVGFILEKMLPIILGYLDNHMTTHDEPQLPIEEEILLPLGAFECAQWIDENFSTGSEEELELPDLETERIETLEVDYPDGYVSLPEPKRTIDRTTWLKSILQIGEFAGVTSQFSELNPDGLDNLSSEDE